VFGRLLLAAVFCLSVFAAGSIWRSQAHHAELSGASHSHGEIAAPHDAVASTSQPRLSHHSHDIPLLI
jgi:hypothetical protein